MRKNKWLALFTAASLALSAVSVTAIAETEESGALTVEKFQEIVEASGMVFEAAEEDIDEEYEEEIEEAEELEEEIEDSEEELIIDLYYGFDLEDIDWMVTLYVYETEEDAALDMQEAITSIKEITDEELEELSLTVACNEAENAYIMYMTDDEYPEFNMVMQTIQVGNTFLEITTVPGEEYIAKTAEFLALAGEAYADSDCSSLIEISE